MIGQGDYGDCGARIALGPLWGGDKSSRRLGVWPNGGRRALNKREPARR